MKPAQLRSQSRPKEYPSRTEVESTVVVDEDVTT
jgi:hypothetical protein